MDIPHNNVGSPQNTNDQYEIRGNMTRIIQRIGVGIVIAITMLFVRKIVNN
jgi:hypothetical protein